MEPGDFRWVLAGDSRAVAFALESTDLASQLIDALKICCKSVQ